MADDDPPPSSPAARTPSSAPARREPEGKGPETGRTERSPTSAPEPRDSAFPPRDSSAPRERESFWPGGEGDKKRLFERAVPEILKRVVERAVESGVGRLQEGPENLRHILSDLKLPKEVLLYLYTQIDDTKNGLYRVAAKEIRDVLEHTQFAEEIAKVLTMLSFEIKTEIRFIPNSAKAGSESTDEDDGDDPKARFPKPEVTAHVAIKDRSKEPRKDRRGREGT